MMKLWIVITCGVLMMYCKPRREFSQVQASETALENSNPLQWVELSESEAYQYRVTAWEMTKALRNQATHPDLAMRAEGPMRADTPHAATLERLRPVARALENMIDGLFQQLVAKYPEYAIIPPPTVDLLVSKNLNAYVSGVRTCYDIYVLFEKWPEGAYPNWGKTAVLTGDSVLGMDSEFPCTERPVTDEFYASFLKNQEDQKCKFKAFQPEGEPYGPDAKYVMLDRQNSPECNYKNLSVYGTHGARRLQVTSMSNHLAVLSKLIEDVPDPEQVLFVLAHELAHYIRAHGLSPKGGFFYKLDDYTGRGVPTPIDAGLGKRYEFLVGLSKLLYSGHYWEEVEGQKTPILMSRLLLQLGMEIISKNDVGLLRASEELPTECRFLVDDTRRKANSLYIGSQWPKDKMTDEKIGSMLFLKYESEMQSCLDVLKIGESQESFMTADDLLKKLRSDSKFKELFSVWLEEAVKKPTLAGMMEELTARVDDLHKNRAADYIKRFSDARIGYYTTEQEADEFATKWLNDMGIDSRSAEKFFVNILKHVPETRNLYPGEIYYDECVRLYCSGYPQNPVPVVDFGDTHHMGCFRAQNMRLIQNLQGEPSSSSGANAFGLPSREQWQQFRELSRSVRLELLPDSKPALNEAYTSDDIDCGETAQ